MSEIQQLAERLARPYEITQTFPDRAPHWSVHDSLIGQVRTLISSDSGGNGGSSHESKAPGNISAIDWMKELAAVVDDVLTRNGIHGSFHLESDVLAVAAHWHEFEDAWQRETVWAFTEYTTRAEEMLGWAPQPRRLIACSCFDCGERGTVIVRYDAERLYGGVCNSATCKAARKAGNYEQGTYTAERAAMLGKQGQIERNGPEVA